MPVAEATHLPARDLLEVVGWIDARVRDAAGRRMGRIRAVVADAEGRPWWVVLRHRGRDVVAPIGAVHGDHDRALVLDRAAESLATCPEPFDAAAHDALLARFAL